MKKIIMKIKYKTSTKSFVLGEVSLERSTKVKSYFTFVIDHKFLLVVLMILDRYQSVL